jgi:nucleoside-diphosphate-sugar epimerase
MDILVTGGSGKVGKYVVEDLMQDHTVSVLDIQNPQGAYNDYLRVDVLSKSALSDVMKPYDAVIHMAGIPHPLDHPGEKVFQVNTVGTFNVLETCAAAGVGSCIFMSSESTLGFAFAKNAMAPLYVPIDEEHLLRPQDPYGLSKVSGEMLCAGYTRTYGMRTLSLRAPWIWVPEREDIALYKTLVSEYQKWSQNLWAYIHVKDVCQAVRCALAAEGTGEHEAFFIAARDQWTDRPTRELLGSFFPDVSIPDGSFTDRESLLSIEKAASILNFKPRYSRDDILQ